MWAWVEPGPQFCDNAAFPLASENEVGGAVGRGLHPPIFDKQLKLEGSVIIDVGADERVSARGDQRDAADTGTAEDEGLVASRRGVGIDPREIDQVAGRSAGTLERSHETRSNDVASAG